MDRPTFVQEPLASSVPGSPFLLLDGAGRGLCIGIDARSESNEHVPLMRFLRPDALLMTAVTGFDDRNMVNQCLLYR